MSVQLTVPFLEKAKAIQNGATFQRGDYFSGKQNGWFAEEELSEDKTESLCSQFGEEKKLQLNKEQELENKWQVVLNEGSTAKMALMLKKNGLPVKELQRVQMLQLFRNPKAGELYIPWDSLINYSSEFAEKYSWENVEEIMTRNHMGANFKEELQTCPLTEEEKTLLSYVIPTVG